MTLEVSIRGSHNEEGIDANRASHVFAAPCEVDIDGVMREIGDALAEEAARRLRMQAQA